MNEGYDDNQFKNINISVIVVNWNTKYLLKKCLDSVYRTIDNLVIEVIVVDNASTDGSLPIMRRILVGE